LATVEVLGGIYMLHNGKNERRLIKRKEDVLKQFLGSAHPDKFKRDSLFGGELFDESNRLDFERFLEI
jgi:hypothetical protein